MCTSSAGHYSLPSMYLFVFCSIFLLFFCVFSGDAVSIRGKWRGNVKVEKEESITRNTSTNTSYSPLVPSSFNASSSVTESTVEDNEERIVLCYLGSWAVYRPGRGKFVVEDIDPFLCTHLVYAFAGLHADSHTIYSLDPYNDLYDNYGKGGYKRFTGLKKVNPDLKTLLGLGGWTEGSAKYSQMVSSKEARTAFINSSVAFLYKYGFDGLDIDWEYPTLRGGSPQDKVNFGLLLTEMRAEFDLHGFLITAAVSAGKLTIDVAYDIQALARYLDLVNLMAYDFHGTWEPFAHHHEPLYAYSQDKGAVTTLNVDYAVRYWLHLGLPPNKLVMGVGTYGRCYTLASPAHTTPYSSAPQPGLPGPYTRARGILGYNEICESHRQGGWVVVRDKNMVSPYTYRGRQWCGYDDPTSAAAKAHYIKDHGLAGAMVWSLDTDDFSGFCSTPKHDPVRGEEDVDVVEEGSETGEEEKMVEEWDGRIVEEDGWTEEDVRRQEDRGVEEVERRLDGENGRRYMDRSVEEMNSLKEYEDNKRRVDRMLEEDDRRDQILGRQIGRLERVDEEANLSIQDSDRITRVNRVVEEESRRNLVLDGTIEENHRIEVDRMEGIQDRQEMSTKIRFPIITTIRTILRNGRPIPTPTPAPIPTPTTTTTDIPTTTTTPPAPTAICHREGFNADPDGDCTVFYECHQEDGRWRVWKFHCPPGTVFVEDLQGCDFPDLHPACPLMSTLSPLAIQSKVSTVPSTPTLKTMSDWNLPTTTMLPTTTVNHSDVTVRSHSNELNYEDNTSPSYISNNYSKSITSQNVSTHANTSSSSSLHHIMSIWTTDKKVKWMKTYRTLMDEGLWERGRGESNTV